MAKRKQNDNSFTLNQREPIDISVEEFVSTNGLEFAYYALKHRALITDTDGLKPVNRRILYGMYNLGLKPTSSTTKAGRIVGEVMGKYHPHGDSSVEEALARMGQDYSLRVPLVATQGAVGKFTGDRPAAARYFEAKISEAGWELVKELQYSNCDFIPTEDGVETEPAALPVRWPVGIINGTSGIAVGYASDMPSHNPDEVISACIAQLKGELNTAEDVMKYIKGPDFPTGGIIIGTDGIKQYIEEGTGTIIVRGKYTIEALSRGRSCISFYEFPPTISGERVLTAINKAQSEKGKFKDISEAKDLSDKKQGFRFDVYTKAGSNPNHVVEELFEYTPCQIKYSVNSSLLIEGRPETGVPMLSLIESFNEYREKLYRRKTEKRLEMIASELNKLEGHLAILVDIDKAIEIIRTSKDSTQAKNKLKKNFKITEEQAEKVLAMRLRQLTKADSIELEKNIKLLKEEQAFLNKVLLDDNLLNNELIKELESTLSIISDPRKTVIENKTFEDLKEEQKEKKKQQKLLDKDVPCYISLMGGRLVKKTLEKPNTEYLQSTSKGMVFTLSEDGQCKELQTESISLDKPTKLDNISLNTSKLITLTNNTVFGTLLVTSKGNTNIVKPPYKEGLMCSLDGDEKLIYATPLYTKDYMDNKSVIVLDEEGKIANVELNKIRATKQGAGFIVLANMENPIVDASILKETDYIKTTTQNGEVKYTEAQDCPTKGRGTKGYLLHKLRKNDTVVALDVLDKLPKNTEVTKRGGRP